MPRIQTSPRHTRDRQPGPPEKPHLIEKSGAPTDADTAPEKPHRNRRGIKNVNAVRYLCAAGVPLCPAIVPRKASPLRQANVGGSCVSTPENSHLCQKVAQQKSDFCQSRRAFQRIRPVMGPEKPHFCPIFEQMALPKRLTYQANGSRDRCPEKAHLNGIRAGKPGFRSRKASPFRLHRPHRALLLCKMTVVSRKSSQQIPVESRETSPLMKTAQKMGRIGARLRSRKFSPMSAQAENCARRHSAGSMAVQPRKTSPLGNLAFHCDPESAHDLSCIGSRRSPNPITSAPAEDHLGSRKTSPSRPESLAT